MVQFDLIVAAVYDRRHYPYGLPALIERRYSKLPHYAAVRNIYVALCV
jgi:hypothetical protein